MRDLAIFFREKTMGVFGDEFYEKLANDTLEFLDLSNQKMGFVYFVKNGKQSDKIKIGCSSNLKNRLLGFTTTFENPLYLIGYIKSKNYRAVESELHQNFKDKNIKNEWFLLEHVDFHNISETYEMKYVCENISVSTVDEKIKNAIEGFDNLIRRNDYKELHDSIVMQIANDLEVGKPYLTKDLYQKYLEMNPIKNRNLLWFGRDLVKCLKLKGKVRRNYKSNGVRWFEVF